MGEKRIDPSKYVIGPDATIEDAGLDKDEVDFEGERLTEARAAAIAEALEKRKANLIPGRKSLSGDGRHSPRVQFRVPVGLEEKAVARAEAEGVSVSTVARRALERYLAS